MTKKKRYSGAEKAKVALEAVKGQLTINEISQKYEVHSTQINRWKKQLVNGVADIFSDSQQHHEANQQESINSLYQQIGQLTVERDYLKKKSELFD